MQVSQCSIQWDQQDEENIARGGAEGTAYYDVVHNEAQLAPPEMKLNEAYVGGGGRTSQKLHKN